ncbi:MAG TPA: oxygenase MpaB family protein [Gammaproteobacteria bacterium]|nr:oxygenase MpaB family protein [Gammaproteobacteria bacterium]
MTDSASVRDGADTDTSAMAAIAGEGILLAGGMRAILLQVAHPAVGRGVAEHSNFTDRPMDRLRATMTYVYCMAFGSRAEKRAIRSQVNAVHRHINGPGYDAFDPELQLWVAATLYDTALTLYERWIRPLDDEMAEIIYRQYRVLGTALQMREEQWPADRAAFRAYWNDMIPRLEVTDAARAVCRDLFHPPSVPMPVRATMPLNRLVTAALLPAPIREAYNIEWNARRQRRFNRFSNSVSLVYPLVPRAIRQFPRIWYMRDMRRRLARQPARCSRPSMNEE